MSNKLKVWFSLWLLTAMMVSVNAQEQANNTLTDQEKADGWQLLFNGKDLTGWSGQNAAVPPECWTVADGEITRSKSKKRGDIVTRELYGDFELTLEWKIASGGN
ncbi:DUF1080 domain-containing protein, partial [Verrucomicrobiota bacterium]